MKKLFLCVLLCTALVSVQAQDIVSVLGSMPESVIPGLEATDKLSLGSDSDSISIQTDIYENITRLAMSGDYIKIKTSDAATIQIKLLPLVNDSKIICVIKTVTAKMSDSRISFYTTKWQLLAQSAGLFPQRSIDWFVKSDADRSSQSFMNAFAVLDILPMTIDASSDANTLSVRLDARGYLSEDDYKRIAPFLTDEAKVLNWDKISYK